ncbi:ankyrin [Hypomontagnella monticulosa]|nr:ankyrin [Hypomontagnella monticulosa]
MASLERLPPETLLDIAGFVAPPDEMYGMHRLQCQRDLASLARVNRRFRDIFDPFLWRYNGEHGVLAGDLEDDQYHEIWSSVFHAAIRNRPDILNKALEHGLPLGSPQKPKPLYVAAEMGNEAAVCWLLSHGVPPDATPKNNDWPQDCVPTWMSPLYAAIEACQESTALALLSRGARIRFLPNSYHGNPQPTPEPAIHAAAKHGLRDVVKYLVENRGVNINEIDGLSMTPLHHAAMHNDDQELIKTMTDLGADPNIETEDRHIPLTQAIGYGRLDAGMALLKAGSNVNPSDVNGFGSSSLVLCASLPIDFSERPLLEQQKTIIQKLIANGADVNGNLDRETALGGAVADGTPGAVYELLRAGADIHKPSGPQNLTPFEIVWSLEEVESLTAKARLFVAAGARLDIPDKSDGKTPLEKAINHCISKPKQQPQPLDSILGVADRRNIRDGYLDELFQTCLVGRKLAPAKILRRHGAVSKTAERVIYRWASEIIKEDPDDEDHQEFSFCLDFHLPKYELETLFSKALDAPNEDRCHILIDRGVLSSGKERKQWLHQAVKRGSFALIRRMCRAGMDVNALNSESETPIMVAMNADYPNVANLLFELGADPFHPRPEPGNKGPGKSAFESAVRKGLFVHARRWWLETPVESRPAEELYVPHLLAANDTIVTLIESSRNEDTEAYINGEGKTNLDQILDCAGDQIDIETRMASEGRRLNVNADGSSWDFESDLHQKRGGESAATT